MQPLNQLRFEHFLWLPWRTENFRHCHAFVIAIIHWPPLVDRAEIEKRNITWCNYFNGRFLRLLKVHLGQIENYHKSHLNSKCVSPSLKAWHLLFVYRNTTFNGPLKMPRMKTWMLNYSHKTRFQAHLQHSTG